ncbi:putative protein-serine/threonine phosphatase [Medicago truncatula]|uniref:Aminotransferase-like plant mobile domain-containing protein n=1 Tax=Medicago truncatula TaxID=3880 RepID=A0A396H4Z4_MEDTR|nr:putative protein-serine/threonine phosphatase [Medicago truncatula]
MTVTLDDVSCLLHIPIDGMLLSHESISRDDAVEMMMRYLGSSLGDALDEVNKTRGAHARLSYLRKIFKVRLLLQLELDNEGGMEEVVQRLRDQTLRIYLMYLIGITLFTDKSATYVDVVHLRYFRDLEVVAGFSWGAARLYDFYMELNHAAHWSCSQLSGYFTLLQAWTYQHFRVIGSKDVWGGYQDDMHPRAMLFASQVGLFTPNSYRGHLDALDLVGVVMAPYAEHHQTCPFERVGLYFGWLRYGNRMVRYLSKRLLRQFGYIQTVPRHPCESAPP